MNRHTIHDVTPDTEGHSIGLLLGMLALQEADRASQRDRDRHRQVEDVKPITKSFPNLRQAALAEAEAARTEKDGAGAMAPGALPDPSAS